MVDNLSTSVNLVTLRIKDPMKAEQAYHAYGSVTNWKNYKGDLMPTFEELPFKIREAWGAFAQRVLEGGSTEEGYSAYGATVEWKNFEGKPIPLYGQAPMTETIKKAWDAAATFLRKDSSGLSCSRDMDTTNEEYDRYEGLTEEEYAKLSPSEQAVPEGPDEVVPF